MLLYASSLARRWLLEEVHGITDLPAHVRNIIGRELAHRTRWMASTTRTQHLALLPQYDRTDLPTELSTGYREVRMDIFTYCSAL
jgi:hypothetical protein